MTDSCDLVTSGNGASCGSSDSGVSGEVAAVGDNGAVTIVPMAMMLTVAVLLMVVDATVV